jgi:hypothetical protein
MLMALGELHGRNLASALMRSRVHNRTRDRGSMPIRLAWPWALPLVLPEGLGALDDRLAFFASDDALLLAARLLDPHNLRFMGCGPRVARPVRNLGPALSNPHRLVHNEATWWKGPIAIEAARKLWRRQIGRRRKAWARAGVLGRKDGRLRFWTSKK